MNKLEQNREIEVARGKWCIPCFGWNDQGRPWSLLGRSQC